MLSLCQLAAQKQQQIINAESISPYFIKATDCAKAVGLLTCCQIFWKFRKVCFTFCRIKPTAYNESARIVFFFLHELLPSHRWRVLLQPACRLQSLDQTQGGVKAILLDTHTAATASILQLLLITKMIMLNIYLLSYRMQLYQCRCRRHIDYSIQLFFS